MKDNKRYCRHYQSEEKGVCKIGISFDSVRQKKAPGVPERLPCRGRWTAGCSKYSGYTPEEIKAQDEEIERYHRNWALTINACREACSKIDFASGIYKQLKDQFNLEILFKMSIQEVEEDNIPFGFLNARWKELNVQIQDGDEIYYFRSAEWTWRCLAGREGFIVVRGDQVVSMINTCIS
jgi:hypothetical protein